MKTFEFTVVASGPDPESADFEDRFFEAGCSDATISFQRGAIMLDFSREGRSFLHALSSAMADVATAGARIERIEPDPLVSLSEIAARTGLSRAAISHYTLGNRGNGFPGPVARATTDSPLWDLTEVARWLRRNGKADVTIRVVLMARILRECNAAVSTRAPKRSRFGRRKSPPQGKGRFAA